MQRTGRAQAGARAGFTLVEVMVVVAIIGILVSVTLPMVGKALETARRTTARTDLASLVGGIGAYYSEYGRYPLEATEWTENNRELLNVLRARPRVGNMNHAQNPRRIVFMNVSDGSLSRGSDRRVEQDPNFIDPWGRPYRVAIDRNFTGTISTEVGTVEKRPVVAWTRGRDPDNPDNWIRSWE